MDNMQFPQENMLEFIDTNKGREGDLLSFLQELNLERAHDALNSCGFNKDNICYINERDLEMVFPERKQIALRAEIREKISAWKLKKKTPAEYEPTAEWNSKVTRWISSQSLEKIDVAPSPAPSTSKSSKKNLVADILNSTNTGKEILSFYAENNELNAEQRRTLLNCILDGYYDSGKNKNLPPSSKELQDIADQICTTFPTESSDMYYEAKKYGKSDSPCGLLYHKFHNLNRLKRKRSKTPSPELSEASNDSSSTKSDQSIADNTEEVLYKTEGNANSAIFSASPRPVGNGNKNEVSNILKSSNIGRRILAFYAKNKKLEPDQRKKMVGCIVEGFFDCNKMEYITPKPYEFPNLARQIVELFPTESEDIYFVDRKNTKGNPTGMLYNKFHNVRSRRKHNCTSTFSENSRNIEEDEEEPEHKEEVDEVEDNDDDDDDDDVVNSDIDNSYVASPIRIHPRNAASKNIVADILNSSNIGKGILLYYAKNNKLDTDQRKQLVNCIVEAFYDSRSNRYTCPAARDFPELVEKLCEIFPTECTDIYYVSRQHGKGHPTGMLYHKFHNRRYTERKRHNSPTESSFYKDDDDGAANCFSFSSTKTHKNIVVDILKSSNIGKGLLSLYAKNNKLHPEQRKQLINCIVEGFYDSKTNRYTRPNSREYPDLAKQIVEIFPTENSEIYYVQRAKRDGKFGNPGGILYYKFQNVKHRHYNSSPSYFDSSNNKDLEEDSETTVLVKDEEAVALKNKMLHMRSTDDEAFDLWKRTFILRNNTSKTSDVKTICSEWPFYTEPGGEKYIDFDFDINFPDRKNLLFVKWTSLAERLVEFYESNLRHKQYKDLYYASLKKKVDINSKNCVIAMLIHAILKPTLIVNTLSDDKKTEKKRRITIAEAMEGCFVHIQSFYELAKIRQDKIDKAISLKQTVQPYIVIIGPELTEICEYYVNFEATLFKFNTFIEALDICFKIFHVFHLQYPKESSYMWYFFQKEVYDIEKPSDPKVPFVTQLIVNLSN